jgi:hypothetical protein
MEYQLDMHRIIPRPRWQCRRRGAVPAEAGCILADSRLSNPGMEDLEVVQDMPLAVLHHLSRELVYQPIPPRNERDFQYYKKISLR